MGSNQPVKTPSPTPITEDCMKILKRISEDEFIAEFLKSEIASKRFGKSITEILDRKKMSRKVVIDPDLESKKDNEFRRALFGEVRGFGMDKDLFEDFPTDVQWFSAVIGKAELKKVKYIDWSYWNDLSDGTRSPIRAAKNIKAGKEVSNVSNAGFLEVFSEIKKGSILPRMIIVAKDKGSRLVVLDGHQRLTAYFIEAKYVPEKLEVIVGFSPKMDKWGLY